MSNQTPDGRPIVAVVNPDGSYVGVGSGGGSSYTITQTVVSITAGGLQIIAANANRKYLEWMVVGTQDVTVAPGAAAPSVGMGMVYTGVGAGKQGAGELFAQGVPTNAFSAIAAAAGSSLVIWEGA